MADDENDTGKLLESRVNIHGLSREAKHRILTTEPNPDPGCYVRTQPYASGAFRQFQPTWMKQYPWFHYSKYKDGVFCRAFAFFAPEKVGGHTLGKFVTKTFNWVTRSEKMEEHAKLEYHMTSMTKMSEFIAGVEHPSEAIDAQLHKQTQKMETRKGRVIDEDCDALREARNCFPWTS